MWRQKKQLESPTQVPTAPSAPFASENTNYDTFKSSREENLIDRLYNSDGLINNDPATVNILMQNEGTCDNCEQ